jgi:phospholipid transport system substrate-binding protein
MKKNRLVFLLSLLLMGLFPWAGAHAAAPDAASALVQDTANRMLAVLEKRRSDLDGSPGLIYELVDEIVVPNFDFDRITQSAMGRNWRKADAGQKRALVREFRQMLVRVYAKSLLNYSGQEIRILPLRPDKRAGHVTVRTEVNEPGGPTIPIDYRMYQKNGAWKVYDIIIDGVSLVSNYRSSFATEIRQKGVDGLIRTLRDRNTEGTA